MDEKVKISRAQFLKTGAALTAGVGALALGGGLLTSREASAGNEVKGSKATWPWAYPTTGISSATARIRAHDAYWSGKGCSYATFEAIVAGLRDTIGTPYNDMPTELMIYGHGGGAGWGATCGTINGAAAAISLVCLKAVSDPMISELYGWFTQTLMPSTIANTIAMANGYGINTHNMNLGQSLNNSPLCHVAVSTWCNEHSTAVGDVKRKERCARMCGDVVVKAVEMLNDQFATSSFTTVFVPPALNATCLSCHGSSGTQHDVAAKMECSACHGTDVYPHTVGSKETERNSFVVNQNYPNPFTSETSVEFSVNKSESVTIDIFNLEGKKIKTLADNKIYNPGTYTLVWDGTGENGGKVSSGMYIFNFLSSSGRKSVSMMKL